MDTKTTDPDLVASTDASSTDPADVQLLARMGYKQELRRQYSTLQVFAIAFSIMGLVPSIASTLSFSLPAGPVGMVWVWDQSHIGGRFMPKIQIFCIYINVALVVATVIALPVGKVTRGGSLNSAHFVYRHIDNETTWPTGWAFMLSWLAPIWSIGSFDSCVHMSEEALHAAKAVPLGIIWSAGSAIVLGFLVLSIIAATMNPKVNITLNTGFGQPMAQIYYDALGRDGALVFVAILCFTQFLIGLSLIVAASRQAWAFSRDGALPFSVFFRHVSKRIKYQPIRVICGIVIVCLVLGLLSLINSAAANALFSLFVASNYLSWGTPIFCRLVWGQDRFRPGEFYTGRFSKPIACVAVAYLLFGVVLSMFPTEGPNPSPSNMNYTIVINGFVWAGCMIYYFIFARHWYTGPQMTVGENASTLSNNTIGSSLAAGLNGNGPAADGPAAGFDLLSAGPTRPGIGIDDYNLGKGIDSPKLHVYEE
ncbi:hypothetical protein PENARI_c003G02688 [Penicillium arizonense]|uniref:Amino acid permease/ SLC12A domain-containing protein n=1 Tax=Penicillium arizonense TaxID=1835702 RepID=A0A1F5LU22_PENAI|nr:hypothetical protein PENARI_c003G02688 [Penicillium arizonense]OGE56662.1 hypothetical protein PENARI_c003G02688 [Penicillium arizonense]